jgi:hypothetical protein
MNKQFEAQLEQFLKSILGGDSPNLAQLYLLHAAGSVYEVAIGQSFTQRVVIHKVIKLYKEKSLVMKGINRFRQWRDSSFF